MGNMTHKTQEVFDNEFASMMSGFDETDADNLYWQEDAKRIARALFSVPEMDPRLVSFVKRSICSHWGVEEEAVDVAVATQLIAISVENYETIRDLEANLEL